MLRTLSLVSLLFPMACAPVQPDMPLDVSHPLTEAKPGSKTRFHIERVGVFKDQLAYGERRGIYVLTDATTGKQWIGISGIGVTELGSHMVGKASQDDER